MSVSGRAINVGIVGCGYWGVNYIRVFNELSGCRVAAVCDVRQDRLDWARGRYHELETYTSLDEMLDNLDIDAVVIATTAHTHFSAAERCLERGKHVLLEKPLTTTVTEGRKMIVLAKQSGSVLMVGHTFLYNEGIRYMKQYVQSTDFGRVYYLHATRTNLGPIRHDVDALWDLAPHDVSIFNYILDSHPISVSAVGAYLLGNERADVGFVTLTYPGEVIANIHVSWADPNKVRQVVAVGSQQRVVFDDLNNMERVRIFEKGVSIQENNADSFGEFSFLLRDGAIVSPKIQVSEPLKTQCAHFIECVQNGQEPLSDAHNGLQVVKVMESIESSLAQKGAPVEVEQ